jgi:hypothetical protein
MTTKKIPQLITINGTEYIAESRAAALQHLKTIVKRATTADILRVGTDNVLKESAGAAE